MLRLIVTSATYRQSSKFTPELRERDPRNRLLARAPRIRLEAEMVRDQAMAVSGLLARKLGGPSVFPAQPDGLWQAAFNGQRTWATSQGADRYRRGLYTFWRRTVPYPSMAAFDAPSREICAVKRVRTNTPLQSFVTLNDPVYVEAAQALARRIVREGGKDVRARVRYGLQICLCREPDPQQIEPLVGSLRSGIPAVSRGFERGREPGGPRAGACWNRHCRGRAGRVDGGCKRALEPGRGLGQRLILVHTELPLYLQLARAHSRRQFLKASPTGLGAFALAMLLEREGRGGQPPRPGEAGGALARQSPGPAVPRRRFRRWP